MLVTMTVVTVSDLLLSLLMHSRRSLAGLGANGAQRAAKFLDH